MVDGTRQRKETPDVVMVTARIVRLTMDTVMVDGTMGMDINMDASEVVTVVPRVDAIKINIYRYLILT